MRKVSTCSREVRMPLTVVVTGSSSQIASIYTFLDMLTRSCPWTRAFEQFTCLYVCVCMCILYLFTCLLDINASLLLSIGIEKSIVSTYRRWNTQYRIELKIPGIAHPYKYTCQNLKWILVKQRTSCYSSSNTNQFVAIATFSHLRAWVGLWLWTSLNTMH